MAIKKEFRGSSRRKSAAATAFERNALEDITIMEAAATGDHHALRRLVGKGANTEAVNDRGETALILAAMVGDADAIRFLIDSGADVDAKSNYGLTTLMALAQNGDLDALRILIRKGADVNAMKPDGTTVLMMGAMFGQTECVRELIAAGADVHARDDYGYMAYMFADGFAECQELLAVPEAERREAEEFLRPGALKKVLASVSRREKRSKPRRKKASRELTKRPIERKAPAARQAAVQGEKAK